MSGPQQTSPWLKYLFVETRNHSGVLNKMCVQQVNFCFEVDKMDDEELHVCMDAPELWPLSVKPSQSATA